MNLELKLARSGSVYARIPAGEMELVLRADGIRRERTGIHARVEVWTNSGGRGARLASDLFNVERQEERARLARMAWKVLPEELQGLFDEDEQVFRMLFDRFCLEAWDCYLGSLEPTIVEGDISIPPPQFVGPFVLNEGGSIIHGQPGAGKSWLLYTILMAIQHGVSHGPMQVREQREVLLINLERSDESVRQRLGAVSRALGLPEHAHLHVLNKRGRSLRDVAAAAKRYVERNGIGVIGLDSISRAGAGTLNSDESANLIIDTLTWICPTWIALGHQAKNADGRASNFGSQMFIAGADLVAGMRSEITDGAINIEIEVDKANAYIERKPIRYRLVMDEKGLAAITHGAAQVLTPEQRELLEVLGDAYEPMTAEQAAEMLGWTVVSTERLLKNTPGIQRAGLNEDRRPTYIRRS